MNEFDKIKGFDGWQKKLLELLDKAEDAAEKKEWPPRRKVSHQLKEFILQSSPNTAEILELDRIAKETRISLLKTTIEERLELIANRQADLLKLTKTIRSAAADNLASAASLRLERTRRVVDSLTATVNDLREFRSSLETGINEGFAASIETLIERIQILRATIENCR